MTVAVRPLRRPGGMTPLFLIAAPDVNALGYVGLARCLGPAESPCSVQGRGDGAAASTPRDLSPAECAARAGEYLAAVRARQPRGPYFLAGMCDGAHLAFAMARQLEAAGERVALLAILDTWPVENSSHHALVVLDGLRRKLAPLGPRERLAWMGDRLRRGLAAAGQRVSARLRGQPPAPAPPTARDRWKARVWPGPGFVPPRYGGRITVLRVRQQAYYRVADPTLGWAARSALPVDLRFIPGAHGTLLRPPHVAVVARALEACLAEARAQAPALPRSA